MLDRARKHPDEAERRRCQAMVDLLIPVVKGWSTETGVAMASLGVQIHGGMGFIEETGAAQFYRDVRITTIYEGTTGIQAGDLVGRKVVRDAGEAMSRLIADMVEELEPLATQASAASALAAVGLLRDATTNLLQSAKQDPERAQAVAVPYLMLAGLAIGGWLMAKSHDLAERHMNEDREFYRSKQQIVRAYIEQVLPQAHALAAVVKSGAGSIVEADPESF
jgi:hypothetical protein